MDGFQLPHVDPIKAFAILILAGAVAAAVIHVYDVYGAPTLRGFESKILKTPVVESQGG